MDRSEGAYQNPMSRALAAFCRRAAEQSMGNWRGEKRERRVRFFFFFYENQRSCTVDRV